MEPEMINHIEKAASTLTGILKMMQRGMGKRISAARPMLGSVSPALYQMAGHTDSSIDKLVGLMGRRFKSPGAESAIRSLVDVGRGNMIGDPQNLFKYKTAIEKALQQLMSPLSGYARRFGKEFQSVPSLFPRRTP